MVLICDVCRQDISMGGTANPTICLFPCFHKYCERCKAQVLATVRPQQGAESRVSCKLCNQHFLLNVLYDYSENQLEKIFCLHCNIKNKATVEWRCKSCQDRYLCAHCSQPHYHSGHELEPVMKPNIPLRSQCSAHSNILATYLCSCQARLCDYCLNNHADGAVSHPHEQRFAYNKLAERARTELDTIRRQSQKEFEQLERLKEKIGKNKSQISVQASQARTEIANQIVELTNSIIRRGNDLVISIDQAEESKLKNCNQLEQEMRHWTDRLRKIESFTENALLTVQQDHPGMWSASMFAQSALFQINKRRDLAKNTLDSFERLPNICYQNGPIINDLNNAINSFGQLHLDGIVKVPTQTTPQNAQMFSVANNNNSQINHSNNNEASIGGTSSSTSQNNNKKQQNQPPIQQNVPPNIRSPPTNLNVQPNINVSINIQQQPRTFTSTATNVLNMSSSSTLPPPTIPLPIPSSIHSVPQQHQISNLTQSPIILQQPELFGSVSSPPNNTGIIQPTVLQQLIRDSTASRQQQQHQRPPLPLLPSNCYPLPVCSNIGGSPPISLPNTPLTPLMPPDHQFQIMRQQNAMPMALQQQQHMMSQQHQQQRLFQQQNFQQKQQQHRMSQPNIIPQQNSVIMPQQVCLPPTQANNVFTQQQHPYMIQQQQFAAQRQQQQQQMMFSQQYHPPVLSPPFHQQVFDSPSQQMLCGTEIRPPPIMLRFPNPRQNPQQFSNSSVIGQAMTSISSSSSSSLPNVQNYHNPSGTTSIEQMMEMTTRVSAVHHPSVNLNNDIIVDQNLTNILSKQQSTAPPEIVDLLDDDEEEEKIKKQHLESSTSATINVVNLDNTPEKNNSKDSTQQTSQNNNSNLLKALRQNKPQSVAADSTVSFAGNQSLNESPIITTGTKRKPEFASIDDNENKPTEKRLAKEIVENVDDKEEEEQRPKNTSPPIDLISTTTAYNGEEEEDNDATNTNEIQQEKICSKNKKEKSGKWATIKPLTSEASTSNSSNNTKKSKTEKKIMEILKNSSEHIKAEESNITVTGDDMWDDYCYVCSQGCDETTGSLGCCESCPRVFHARCHIPKINGLMEDLPDDWRCSICLECEPLTHQSQEFGDTERLICSKVFLVCFEDNTQVELFVNKVPATETDYHLIIKNPIWLKAIGDKINKKAYTCVVKFLDDMNLLFRNFSTFNSPNDPLASKGKSVYTRYIQAVKKFMPFYQKNIWIYVSLYNIRFNSTQASSSLNLQNEEDNLRNRLKGAGKKRGSSKAKSQTPA